MMITLAIDHGPKHTLKKGLLCDMCGAVALVLISDRTAPIGFKVPEEGTRWQLESGRALLLALHLCPSCKEKQKQQRQNECLHLHLDASGMCLDCGWVAKRA